MERNLHRFIRVVLFGMAVMFFTNGCASSPRPWTKMEKTLLISSFLACGADIATTERAQANGAHEANTIVYGDHASRSEMVIGMGISQGLIFAIGHYIPAARKPLFGISVVGHGAATVNNVN